jgi:hypothetical protein
MRLRFQPLLRVILSATLLFAAIVTSAESQVSAPAHEPVNDLRVIVDISGSMKKNDPHNLRAPALRLLIGLLPNGSQAGIWTFGQYVNMQVKHTQVDDAWKKEARNESNNIHNRGLFTNIEQALRRATYGWDQADANYNRHLILLTDGMVDISREEKNNSASRDRIISQLLPGLKKSGVKIHTIALSEQADHNLLKNLSLTTSGWYEKVTSVDSLQKTFLRIFEKSSPVETVPIRGNRFQIDDNISDMTVLLFHGARDAPVRITTPQGDQWDHDRHPPQTTWYRDASYTMITMNKPSPGDWSIEANMDPDNRVIVATNVRLKTSKLPSAMLQTDTSNLHTYLMADNKILNDRDLLGLMSFNLHMDANGKRIASAAMHDDGNRPDEKAQDGIYSTVLAQAGKTGFMNITISAEGKTFSREYRQAIKVYRDVIDIAPPVNRDNHTTIKILAIPELTYLDSIDAKVTTAEGATLPLSRSSDVEWQSTIPSRESAQDIVINVSGILSTGKPFTISRSLTLPATMLGDAVTLVEIAPIMDTPQEAAPATMETDIPVADAVSPDATEEEHGAENGAEPSQEAAEIATETPPAEAEVPAEETQEKEVATEEPPPAEDSADKAKPKAAKTNWWLVFAIVLSVNLLLLGGGAYGYFYWKKRKVKISDSFGEDEPAEAEAAPEAAAAEKNEDVEDAASAVAMAEDGESAPPAGDIEEADSSEIEGLAQIGGIAETEQSEADTATTDSADIDDVAQQLEEDLVALSDDGIASVTQEDNAAEPDAEPEPEAEAEAEADNDTGIEDGAVTTEQELDVASVLDVGEPEAEAIVTEAPAAEEEATTETAETETAEVEVPESEDAEVEIAAAATESDSDIVDADDVDAILAGGGEAGEMEDMGNIDNVAQQLEEELSALAEDEVVTSTEPDVDTDQEAEVIAAEAPAAEEAETAEAEIEETETEPETAEVETSEVEKVEAEIPEAATDDSSSNIVDADDIDGILGDFDDMAEAEDLEDIDDLIDSVKKDTGEKSQ